VVPPKAKPLVEEFCCPNGVDCTPTGVLGFPNAEVDGFVAEGPPNANPVLEG